MQKYQDVALVTIGGTTVPLQGAEVLVSATGLTTAATIFSNNGVTAATNPLTTDSTGRFSFYAANGRYDLLITKAGYSNIAVSDVLLHDPLDTYGSNVIPSATSLVLLTDRDVMQVSGTTTITSISTAQRGRTITLMFQGALTFTDGGNLKLASSMTTTADDTITLTCADGTNWYEVARSVN